MDALLAMQKGASSTCRSSHSTSVSGSSKNSAMEGVADTPSGGMDGSEEADK
eukprot:CAMPEP_0185195512 /NCGR_PEP_ID=MMETSP1140-20130426/34793_1 /TAXON_ID=298111 /ORGANISM="Pavlova sp., Strain CCMP459" /LENGTH=51 /DNA_ID=CAMNT_0027762489 /DNA_START=116 /DNA_END=271 /DNA_ORIENTATION=-